MRQLILSAFSAALLAPLAAQAQTIDASNPQSIVGALQNLGYRAELTTDNSGDPLIRSSSQGVDFTIWFYNCEDGLTCDDIQFYSGFDTRKIWTADEMNEWNDVKLAGTAAIDDDGDPRIRYFVGGLQDMSPEAFEATLKWWDIALGDFTDFIDW